MHPADTEQKPAFGVRIGSGSRLRRHAFATVALFSLTVVLSFIEDNMVIIKVLGGISVIIVGMTILLKKSGRSDPPQPGRQRQQPWSDYLSVLLITLANPAYILIFVALFAALGVNHEGIPYANGLLMIPRRAVRHFAVVVLADVLHQLSASQIPAPPPAVDEPDIGKRHRDARSRSHFIHLHSHESTCP